MSLVCPVNPVPANEPELRLPRELLLRIFAFATTSAKARKSLSAVCTWSRAVVLSCAPIMCRNSSDWADLLSGHVADVMGLVSLPDRLTRRLWIEPDGPQCEDILVKTLLTFRHLTDITLPGSAFVELVEASNHDPHILPEISLKISLIIPPAVPGMSPTKHRAIFRHHLPYADLPGRDVLMESRLCRQITHLAIIARASGDGMYQAYKPPDLSPYTILTHFAFPITRSIDLESLKSLLEPVRAIRAMEMIVLILSFPPDSGLMEGTTLEELASYCKQDSRIHWYSPDEPVRRVYWHQRDDTFIARIGYDPRIHVRMAKTITSRPGDVWRSAVPFDPDDIYF